MYVCHRLICFSDKVTKAKILPGQQKCHVDLTLIVLLGCFPLPEIEFGKKGNSVMPTTGRLWRMLKTSSVICLWLGVFIVLLILGMLICLNTLS